MLWVERSSNRLLFGLCLLHLLQLLQENGLPDRFSFLEPVFLILQLFCIPQSQLLKVHFIHLNNEQRVLVFLQRLELICVDPNLINWTCQVYLSSPRHCEALLARFMLLTRQNIRFAPLNDRKWPLADDAKRYHSLRVLKVDGEWHGSTRGLHDS